MFRLIKNKHNENISRYQPALGNERINTKTNKYKKYFEILYCSFVFRLIKNKYNENKAISQYQEIIMFITIKYNKNI